MTVDQEQYGRKANLSIWLKAQLALRKFDFLATGAGMEL